VFRHLLVPLDGSSLAEAVLPAVASLAARLGTAVTLLHVRERRAPATIHGARHLTDLDEAERYLEAVERSLGLRGCPVTRHVHSSEEDDVAQAIVQHAEEFRADLIVLSTHGRGGLRGLVMGSIAQRVLQQGTAPVFLVHPAGRAPTAFACRTILVPLDGSAAHESALDAAVKLARAHGARLHLVIVVPTPVTLPGDTAAAGVMMPLATSALLDLATEGAAQYVGCLVERLKLAGVEATAQVRRGEPAANLVEAAEQVGADLLTMATHGRSGLSAFWEGSVSAKVLTRSGRPVILVHASNSGFSP